MNSIAVSDIAHLPENAGVYRFYDKHRDILYVGKAKNLKRRVASYFRQGDNHSEKTRRLVERIVTISYISTHSDFEALLLEAHYIKAYQPKYNVIWKDDKHYLYICITREEFPKILLARANERIGEYFGPFPASLVVKRMMRLLRRIFPFCTTSDSKRVCFYTHIGLCDPCPAYIKKTSGQEYIRLKRQYLQHIASIRLLLRGSITRIAQQLEKEMKQYADQKEYEQAARIRDRIRDLQYLTNHHFDTSVYIENPSFFSMSRQKEGDELRAILTKEEFQCPSLHRIECYDISNIAGTLATGSMVTFVNGLPEKNLYRRFRIRFALGPNDFAMMREVLERRFSHREWKLPDLFIFDGGKPQLLAVGRLFPLHDVRVPYIGLAKKREELVLPLAGEFRKIRLPSTSHALHLVQRIRDEAHRFAHGYHTFLRLKHLSSAFGKRKQL